VRKVMHEILLKFRTPVSTTRTRPGISKADRRRPDIRPGVDGGKLLLFRKWTRVLSQGEAVQLYQLAQIKEKPMYTLVRGPLRKHKKVLSLPGVGTLRRRPL
jgi:hypothetical protein